MWYSVRCGREKKQYHGRGRVQQRGCDKKFSLLSDYTTVPDNSVQWLGSKTYAQRLCHASRQQRRLRPSQGYAHSVATQCVLACRPETCGHATLILAFYCCHCWHLHLAWESCISTLAVSQQVCHTGSYTQAAGNSKKRYTLTSNPLFM